jgi:hypothetical protein
MKIQEKTKAFAMKIDSLTSSMVDIESATGGLRDNIDALASAISDMPPENRAAIGVLMGNLRSKSASLARTLALLKSSLDRFEKVFQE